MDIFWNYNVHTNSFNFEAMNHFDDVMQYQNLFVLFIETKKKNTFKDQFPMLNLVNMERFRGITSLHENWQV